MWSADLRPSPPDINVCTEGLPSLYGSFRRWPKVRQLVLVKSGVVGNACFAPPSGTIGTCLVVAINQAH